MTIPCCCALCGCLILTKKGRVYIKDGTITKADWDAYIKRFYAYCPTGTSLHQRCQGWITRRPQVDVRNRKAITAARRRVRRIRIRIMPERQIRCTNETAEESIEREIPDRVGNQFLEEDRDVTEEVVASSSNSPLASSSKNISSSPVLQTPLNATRLTSNPQIGPTALCDASSVNYGEAGVSSSVEVLINDDSNKTGSTVNRELRRTRNTEEQRMIIDQEIPDHFDNQLDEDRDVTEEGVASSSNSPLGSNTIGRLTKKTSTNRRSARLSSKNISSSPVLQTPLNTTRLTSNPAIAPTVLCDASSVNQSDYGAAGVSIPVEVLINEDSTNTFNKTGSTVNRELRRTRTTPKYNINCMFCKKGYKQAENLQIHTLKEHRDDLSKMKMRKTI